MVNCPMCDTEIDVDVDELDEGDDLTCEECGASLRVSSTNPVELESADAAEEEEESFDDEDEEDFDEDEEEEEEEDERW